MPVFVRLCLILALAFCCLPAETGLSQCCKKTRNFQTSTVPVWDQIGMIHPFQKSHGPPVWEQIGSISPWQRTHGYPPVWEQIGSLNPYTRINLPPITPCTDCLTPTMDVAPAVEEQAAPEQSPQSDAQVTPIPDDGADNQPSPSDENTTLAAIAEKKRQARAAADSQ